MELAFFGKVRDIVVRSDKQPDHFLFKKPLVVNLGPVLLDDLDARDFSQPLSCSAVLRTCGSEDAMRGQIRAL
jgi:hypothetical protein